MYCTAFVQKQYYYYSSIIMRQENYPLLSTSKNFPFSLKYLYMGSGLKMLNQSLGLIVTMQALHIEPLCSYDWHKFKSTLMGNAWTDKNAYFEWFLWIRVSAKFIHMDQKIYILCILCKFLHAWFWITIFISEMKRQCHSQNCKVIVM